MASNKFHTSNNTKHKKSSKPQKYELKIVQIKTAFSNTFWIIFFLFRDIWTLPISQLQKISERMLKIWKLRQMPLTGILPELFFEFYFHNDKS